MDAESSIARKAAPFRDVELPAVDLVHTDFGMHYVLFRTATSLFDRLR